MASRFVLPGPNPGLLVPGNIDIFARPVIKLPDGSVATVRSMSFGIDNVRVNGKVFRHLEVLVPTVGFKGAVISGSEEKIDRAAIANFDRTSKHLGMFDNWRHASSYAVRLHKEQARFYFSQIRRKRRG